VIQVKSGKARYLFKQMDGTTQEALNVLGKKNYKVLGYAPEQSDKYIQIQQYESKSITNNIDELLKWIGGE
jgi:hypothetical protein